MLPPNAGEAAPADAGGGACSSAASTDRAQPGVAADSAALAGVTGEVRAAAMETLDERLAHLVGTAGGEDRQAIAQAVRDAILPEIDTLVQARTEEFWNRGKEMLGQMQKKHTERNSRLEEEVKRCQQNCEALEADNGKLKDSVSQLLTRFQVLGKVLSNAGAGAEAQTATGHSTPKRSQSTATPTTPPQSLSGSSKEVTPLPSPNLACGVGFPLPSIPDFPIFVPGAASQAVADASVAQAIAMQSATVAAMQASSGFPRGVPQRTQLSLATSLTPSEPKQQPNSGTFSMTLRKADGADLGLNLSNSETDRVLRIEGIRKGGAVEAWNRLAADKPDKVVNIGDKIVSVNGIADDPDKMLEECKVKQLLKLTIARAGHPLSAVPVTLPAKAGSPAVKAPPASGTPTPSASAFGSPTTLRADASVFVPQAPAAGAAAAKSKGGAWSAVALAAAASGVVSAPGAGLATDRV
mmetsp:Transcript_47201/g.132732  ORF Transcript_47201/g.132732 Transcript_47201/m.132732 type:complete len:468 (+) Transcript_47201:66-1469(+)